MVHRRHQSRRCGRHLACRPVAQPARARPDPVGFGGPCDQDATQLEVTGTEHIGLSARHPGGVRGGITERPGILGYLSIPAVLGIMSARWRSAVRPPESRVLRSRTSTRCGVRRSSPLSSGSPHSARPSASWLRQRQLDAVVHTNHRQQRRPKCDLVRRSTPT
jgi:hypothetical protein